ncbi:MAG: heme ABC exporter ATP-binding protein CcmA [Gammaproteobacteria bacterium]
MTSDHHTARLRVNSFPEIRVRATELELWRGELCLFDGLTFELKQPVLHVRGANGSGKTTLLKVLCGLTSTERGEVRWSQDTESKPVSAARGLLAYAGHQDGLNPALTVLENLQWGAGLYHRVSAADIAHLAQAHHLENLLPLLAGSLSAGQKRRVALMRTLLTQCPVWIWDEPYANLDTAGVDWVNSLIREHVEQGGSLILSAHQKPDVDASLVQSLELGQ